MSLATKLHATPVAARRICFSTTVTDLAEIYEDDVNAVVWQRPAPAVIRSGAVASVLPSISLEAGIAASRVRGWLQRELPAEFLRISEDIAELAAMYACLFDVEYLGIRLKTLDRPMCPRFHVDRVVCHLLTTYEGPGTEYLANEDVDRSLLGRPLTEVGQLPFLSDRARVQRLPAGAVLLCKGESWPGNAGHGFVHRSPAGVDAERLMLSIDGLSDS